MGLKFLRVSWHRREHPMTKLVFLGVFTHSLVGLTHNQVEDQLSVQNHSWMMFGLLANASKPPSPTNPYILSRSNQPSTGEPQFTKSSHGLYRKNLQLWGALQNLAKLLGNNLTYVISQYLSTGW